MIALLAALALSQAATPSPTTDKANCVGELCNASVLDPFFRKLATARKRSEPVRILQLGDSNTASDQVTGSWRTLLQARYGDGGRGVLPPGRPYPGYLTRGITAHQSDGWQIDGVFGPTYHPSHDVPIGLSGWSATAASSGATMALTADGSATFRTFTVCALRGPKAGSIDMTVGARTERWNLSEGTGPGCRTITADKPAGTAVISVASGPVTITSWSTEKVGGGVVLSSLGIVGAQFIHLAREDDAIVKREFATYAPDLIVISFGTNEAFRPGFSAADYDEGLKASLRRIKRLMPGVPVLVLGAADAGTKLTSLQTSPAGTSAPCAGETSWRPPAALPVVQEEERVEALSSGAAFWDWSASMGGRCTANDWSSRSPALMRGDHVHFTRYGGDRVAASLENDIETAAAAAGATAR